MHSEEVNKLNVALRYCDQLKSNLQASILHVQMLNRKYNTTDYTLSFSTSQSFGSPQRNQSKHQQNSGQASNKKEQIRSVKDIKHNFNHIIVNGIKLRREIETTTIQLKMLRSDHQIESPYIIKRRLQSPIISSTPSSSGCRHGRCFENSSLVAYDSRAAPVIRSSYSFSGMSTTQQTPPARKRTRETFHNQLAMRTMSRTDAQSPVKVKKFRFQSTPIKINEPTTPSNSHSNRSCSLNSSAINSSSCSFSQSIVGDASCNGNTKCSPIKPCFRNSNSNASVRVECGSPKRIRWTPVVKVKRISIYQ